MSYVHLLMHVHLCPGVNLEADMTTTATLKEFPATAVAPEPKFSVQDAGMSYEVSSVLRPNPCRAFSCCKV